VIRERKRRSRRRRGRNGLGTHHHMHVIPRREDKGRCAKRESHGS